MVSSVRSFLLVVFSLASGTVKVCHQVIYRLRQNVIHCMHSIPQVFMQVSYAVSSIHLVINFSHSLSTSGGIWFWALNSPRTFIYFANFSKPCPTWRTFRSCPWCPKKSYPRYSKFDGGTLRCPAPHDQNRKYEIQEAWKTGKGHFLQSKGHCYLNIFSVVKLVWRFTSYLTFMFHPALRLYDKFVYVNAVKFCVDITKYS